MVMKDMHGTITIDETKDSYLYQMGEISVRELGKGKTVGELKVLLKHIYDEALLSGHKGRLSVSEYMFGFDDELNRRKLNLSKNYDIFLSCAIKAIEKAGRDYKSTLNKAPYTGPEGHSVD